MPELPEVETVAQSLRAGVVGDRIEAVAGSGLSLRRKIPLAALRRAALGADVVQIDRHGKYLLIRFSTGSVLLAHLGMSGRFEIGEPGQAPLHTHLIMGLASGRELRYVDARRFGLLLAFRADAALESPELRALGPDPFGADFTAASLHASLEKSRRRVRDVLLDQHVVAGIGNIYASEALHRAGIAPTVRGGGVSRARAERLRMAILVALRQGLENGGTTLRDYVDANGRRGSNQERLLVYGREGEPCFHCSSTIRRVVIGARSAFYCPRCQR